MLVGRQQELARVAELLDGARRGRSGTLLVTGEPGIGKTSLLAAARAAAGEMRWLSATGVESERELPFASLHELLRPALSLLGRLPPTQAEALEAALALREGEPDGLAVAAGTLSLLVELSEEGALAVVLDDAQWLDQASARALAFAARRMAGEQIAFLVAARDGSDHAFVDAPALAVGPLDPESATRLVRTRPEPVSADDERRLLAVARGNPLVLLELSPGSASGLASTATTAERLRRSFSPQLERLGDRQRTALLLAALEPDPLAVSAAGSALGIDDAVREARETTLVHTEDGRLAFRHPVVRTLVAASADREAARAAHAALAEALDAEADRDRRAWHRAAAAEGPDEEVASLLEQTASRASARGGQAAAARALERAAELSPDRGDAARRYHDASRATFWGGDAGSALELARRGLAIADDPRLRADLVAQLASVGAWNGPALAESVVHEALAADGLDDVRRSRLTYELLDRRLMALDAPAALELAPRQEETARKAGPWWEPRHLAAAACAYLLGGERGRAEELATELESHPAMPAGFAFLYLSLERYDVLRRSLDETLAAGREEGNLLRVTWNRMCLAHLELQLGRLSAAASAAAEAMELGETIGTPALVGDAASALAAVHAWRGQADACSRVGELALRIARDHGDRYQQLLAHQAIAHGALGEGRLEDVVAELEPAAHEIPGGGRDPANLVCLPTLVEALVQLGERDRARAWLDRYADVARASGRVGPNALCDRCEALLEPDVDAAVALLERAARGFASVGHQLEAARSRLVLGERLRRAGRRRDARVHLREAFRVLGGVGAEPWVERAAAELRATGEAVGDREAPLPELTPQEQNIARLVAEGRTNKEIAAALFLSPKTVEYHLAGTFRKLNIHSRAELARIVTAQQS